MSPTTEEIVRWRVDKWDRDSCYYSTMQLAAKLPSHKKIVEMGWLAVPHLIELLRKKPRHLFIALGMITLQQPIKDQHRGNVPCMAQDWIEWWDTKGRTEYEKQLA